MYDYKTIYHVLFNAATNAISILQEAQKTTEEMFVSSEPAEVVQLKIVATVQDDGSRE